MRFFLQVSISEMAEPIPLTLMKWIFQSFYTDAKKKNPSFCSISVYPNLKLKRERLAAFLLLERNQ